MLDQRSFNPALITRPGDSNGPQTHGRPSVLVRKPSLLLGFFVVMVVMHIL
jgi:hypothetical protein